MSDLLQTLAESKIREAIDHGDFATLPGYGHPLELEDLSHVPPELRMAYKVLKNNGFVPEEMALQKEIHSIDELITKSINPEDKTALAKQRLELNLRYKILMERRRLKKR
jgi:hypothetical protein